MAPAGALAGSRATEEEMEFQRPPLDDLMRDVVGNYRAIEGMYLRLGRVQQHGFVRRLQTARDAPGCSRLEAAACDFLTARAYYWLAFQEFKSTQHPNVFDEYRSPVIEAYLRAFEDVSGPDLGKAAETLRRDIIRSFVSVLATNVWGKSLAPEWRKKVGADFVERLDADEELAGLAPWPERMKMYQNLGLESRLKEFVANVPSSYEGLLRLVKEGAGVLEPEQELQIVAALEDAHAETLYGEAEGCAIVGAAALRGKNYAKAQRYLERAATLDKQYYLPLCLASFRTEWRCSPEISKAYADSYLMGALGTAKQQGGPLGYTRAEAYRRLTESLSRVSQFATALEFIERYEEDSACDHTGENDAAIFRVKGRCLESLGRNAEAAVAYEAFLAKAADMPVYDHVRDIVKRRLSRLRNADGGK
jgi:tetratricopeptide (TPR) repeat protein